MMRVSRNSRFYLAILAFLLLNSVSALLSWQYFPAATDLNRMSYESMEYEFGKPTVVMEQKYIAWEKRVGVFTTIVEISHEKKIAGNTSNLLSDKALWLIVGRYSVKLVSAT